MVYSIAIDGPAGAGKSTIANTLAKKFNILYLNTGELYRSLSYACYKYNFDYKNQTIVEFLAYTLDFQYKITDDEKGKHLEIYLNDENITPKLHTKEISDIAPYVATYPQVREHFCNLQRSLASTNNIVMEGRDIGTVVLPNAQFKFYIDASIEVRAQRRYKELLENGKQVSYESIYASIEARDHADKTRKHSPLVRSSEAIYIDTSHKDVDSIVNEMSEYIVSKNKTQQMQL